MNFDLEKYLNPVFIETGTYKGHGVQQALDSGFEKVYSIEVKKEFYEDCKNKFSKEISEGKVNLVFGDSLECLKDIIKDIESPITFWLDGHGGYSEVGTGIKACPLYEELESNLRPSN